MYFRGRTVQPPSGYRTGTYLIRPIRESDAELDYEAVMESREFLRAWEQSSWPEDDFTVEANRADMATLVARHDDGHAFAYTVMNLDETECFGCLYISAPEMPWFADAAIAPIAGVEWADVEAMVSFWIRASRLPEGLDRAVLGDLRQWLATQWPFERWVFMTNEQFEQQVAMIEATDLVFAFDIKVPKHDGRDRAYAEPAA